MRMVSATNVVIQNKREQRLSFAHKHTPKSISNNLLRGNPLYTHLISIFVHYRKRDMAVAVILGASF